MPKDKIIAFISKNKYFILLFLLFSFLFFSFYPTIFELSRANKLYDQNREFILEHNYYWPDFNLYLSKVHQGLEGRLTALERYTSEPHQGSLIQEFYVVLGLIGKPIGLDANFSYQMGRFILSPLLLLIIIFFIIHYFKNPIWQILGFLIILVSASFPKFYTDGQGINQIGRYMEWWSNIDALQRITFIPHILFGQVISFFILYQFIIIKFQPSTRRLILLVILGNAAGIVFPPSLITLNSVVLILLIISLVKKRSLNKYLLLNTYYLILTMPSLLYIFFITQIPPWSALVEFHKTHPMMIPFWDYILGTGPIFFLGLIGAIIAVIKKDRDFYPLIFWVLVTFLFALFFTHIKEQSPLRFTQTGLFIPLGLLGVYVFQKIGNFIDKRIVGVIVFLYLIENIFMMKVSLDWQTTFITQRVQANVPPVPYPPQTMYPLKNWMEGIRWFSNNTNDSDVILAQITAGNFIPAYSGKTVYFGQSNTVNYNAKQVLVDRFFKGEMASVEATNFLKAGRVTYIFFSLQEKEYAANKELNTFYPFLTTIFTNDIVTIYKL